MKVSRRTFLRMAGAAGGAALMGGPQKARGARLSNKSDGTWAVLVDTTRCIGCRFCEMACSKTYNLPAPERFGQPSIFDRRRDTSTRAFTVVNRVSNPPKGGRATFAKIQCMNCVEPACASACPVSALQKTPEGPVIYNADRCIGCRYCMLACPFGIPKFEYEKAVPYIRKCSFCIERIRKGQQPACTAACPVKAIIFGKRGELLEVARTRIYQNPGRYVHHIYGEHEAGGTGFLYLSAVPFERIGLPMDVGTTPYPALTQTSLSAVPFILTLGPPFLLAIHAFAKNREEAARRGGEGR